MQQFFIGVVENRIDPLKLGRCQVRIIGLHNEDKAVLPTDKLPWAMPIQGSNSAGISGIGNAPTGLVEGSVVKIEFADPDQQQPFIIGSIGGIPQDLGSIESTDESVNIKDSDGELPSQIDTVIPVSTGIEFKPAKQYTTISDRCLEFIKNQEKLRLTSYQDSGGVWTIGYGTTIINNQPVVEGMTITAAQAEQYLIQHINDDAADAVRKNVSVQLTPSMFDALTSFVYNIGRGNFYKSELRTTLNGGDYLGAAGLFILYNKDNGEVQAGLTNRRISEKNLYLEDGIPNSLGIPTSLEQPVQNVDNIGFKDPKKIYPLYRNEPDTNRLARHEQIDKTIVRKKEVSREKAIPIAGGGTWDQPKIPYNTEYPYNNVYQSESGHVFEFDDTENSERIHLYHKKGTFTEIDANGTQVNRIVGDGFTILERNGYVHVNGALNVTIDGANNVLIGGTLNVDIIGKTTVNILNNADINVSGTTNLSIKENFNVKAAKMNFEATDIDIKGNLTVSGDVDINTNNYKLSANIANIRYESELHTHIGGDTYSRHDTGIDYSCPADPSRTGDTDCSDVTTADNATATGLATPSGVKTPETVLFKSLDVITRGSEAVAHYETPEEGDATTYQEYLIDKGLVEEDELDSGTEVATQTPTENKVVPITGECGIIYATEEFTGSFQLSKYFTLGSLTKNYTRKPINQQGLTKQEIVCNLKQLSINCLDIIYDAYPNMIINSGFRRPGDTPNASKKSQHNTGMAADIKLNGFSREEHYNAIQRIQQLIPYDQLILEYSGSTSVWIHISYNPKSNRKQIFTMRDHKRVGDMGQFKLIV